MSVSRYYGYGTSVDEQNENRLLAWYSVSVLVVNTVFMFLFLLVIVQVRRHWVPMVSRGDLPDSEESN